MVNLQCEVRLRHRGGIEGDNNAFMMQPNLRYPLVMIYTWLGPTYVLAMTLVRRTDFILYARRRPMSRCVLTNYCAVREAGDKFTDTP